MRAGTRSRRFALASAVILGSLVAVAVLAPLLAPYDPAERTGIPFSAPSVAHPLGTNDIGQDLLSELIYGARISLLIGVVAALAATVLGTAIGAVAGYARGWLDTALMRLVDVVLALPVLPLTIVIGVFLGPGLATQIVVIASVIWAETARELRSQVLSLREHDHIQALRAMGAGPGHVLPRHVLPAVAPLVVPQFVLATKKAILLEASLAFLGLGDITAKSWGTMLSLAQSRSAFLTDAWLWWVLPPGVAIAVTVLAFALLAYAFEERARPSLRDRVAGPPRTADPRPGSLEPSPRHPLVIDDLTVTYGAHVAVDRVSLHVAPGELVGLVGESGSGKSTVAGATLGLLPAAARVTGGRVLVCGHDVTRIGPTELRALRGRHIGLVPQEAMSALNPVHTVGDQLGEALTAHGQRSRDADHAPDTDRSRDAVRTRAAELLDLVALDPARARDYPHQLSGGMRQRVVIAIALAGDPTVLVADEPTSGLDVLVQAEVLDLLDGLRRRLELAVLVVSHDLPMIERIADRIAVMQAGRVVELGPAARVLADPAHPYTRRLVEATPRLRLPVEVAGS
ncbi:MAG TPA: dipeptide/oligopeptide/nickel ABC transporter permease/ATP-binding protein [Pseudonocardiaceae bacterium]|nr:dipeptide/oligopeptide/nickel ABC transporter permease/ATP-binding protein [Pseudonocardiaceae bacterium]